jgi:RNA polymerase sigma-70 factor (ECF subfamily)
MAGAASKEAVPLLRVVEQAPSDMELIQALQERRRDAAVALYDRYGRLINKLVWRLLGGDSEHDDVVHQVFVNLLGSVRTIRRPERLRSWIVTVTVHTVRHEIRSRKVRRIVRLDTPRAETARSGEDPERLALLASAYRALDRLAVDDRIAFLLRFVEGNSLSEVAAACACSLATAKRRLHRACAAMEEEAAGDAVLAHRPDACSGEQ